jgi:hypothetical protein
MSEKLRNADIPVGCILSLIPTSMSEKLPIADIPVGCILSPFRQECQNNYVTLTVLSAVFYLHRGKTNVRFRFTLTWAAYS